MSATTWRADLVAAHVAILEDQKAATPDHLRKVHASRPGAFPETPCAYIGSRNENLTHDSGTRIRTIALEVVLVDSYAGDNVQTGDRLDELVDFLVDRYDLVANVQKVGSSIIELTSITDADIELLGTERSVTYRGVFLTFGKSAKLEGRQ